MSDGLKVALGLIVLVLIAFAIAHYSSSNQRCVRASMARGVEELKAYEQCELGTSLPEGEGETG